MLKVKLLTTKRTVCVFCCVIIYKTLTIFGGATALRSRCSVAVFPTGKLASLWEPVIVCLRKSTKHFYFYFGMSAGAASESKRAK